MPRSPRPPRAASTRTRTDRPGLGPATRDQAPVAFGPSVAAPAARGGRGTLRDHADRPVGLEHGQVDVLDVRDAVLADRAHQVTLGDALLPDRLLQHHAVPDQDPRLALERHADAIRPLRGPVDDPVDDDERQGGREAADQRRVLADHRVLHAVGDQEHEHQVGDRQLADVALAAERATAPAGRGRRPRCARRRPGCRIRGRGSPWGPPLHRRDGTQSSPRAWPAMRP